MTQVAKNQLKWRLADVQGSGSEQVSLVMPQITGNDIREFLLPTDIPSPQTTVEDLRWSDEDLELFFHLLEKQLGLEIVEDMPLDLQDEGVINILHVVAAARFIIPETADGILAADISTVMEEYEPGDLAAIHTIDGFKSGIIVAMDSIEVTFVLLDCIEDADQQLLFDVYDTLLVNKHSLLPADFGSVASLEEPQTLH